MHDAGCITSLLQSPVGSPNVPHFHSRLSAFSGNCKPSNLLSWVLMDFFLSDLCPDTLLTLASITLCVYLMLFYMLSYIPELKCANGHWHWRFAMYHTCILDSSCLHVIAHTVKNTESTRMCVCLSSIIMVEPVCVWRVADQFAYLLS